MYGLSFAPLTKVRKAASYKEQIIRQYMLAIKNFLKSWNVKKAYILLDLGRAVSFYIEGNVPPFLVIFWFGVSSAYMYMYVRSGWASGLIQLHRLGSFPKNFLVASTWLLCDSLMISCMLDHHKYLMSSALYGRFRKRLRSCSKCPQDVRKRWEHWRRARCLDDVRTTAQAGCLQCHEVDFRTLDKYSKAELLPSPEGAETRWSVWDGTDNGGSVQE